MSEGNVFPQEREKLICMPLNRIWASKLYSHNVFCILGTYLNILHILIKSAYFRTKDSHVFHTKTDISEPSLCKALLFDVVVVSDGLCIGLNYNMWTNEIAYTTNKLVFYIAVSVPRI